MYPDIDYINDIYFYVSELLFRIRSRKLLSEESVNEMINLTIQLLDILELYLNDKYNY